ncbi:carbonic anhydrase [Pseudomonadota bacterium]
MKKAITAVVGTAAPVLILVQALVGTAVAGGAHSHSAWSYESGSHGPENWARLRPEYFPCRGEQQSPINIRKKTALKSELGPIKINWDDAPLRVYNSGHSIQVNYERGSTLKTKAGSFVFFQYHFHSPSDHAINGKLYDMEVHFVHKAANGELAIVAVFFEEGKENENLIPIWDNLPPAGKTTTPPDIKIKATDLLPNNMKDYFHYKGSLTTPPCSETVNWYVLANPLEASKAQLKKLSKLISANNRPLQQLHRRFVLTND